MEFVVRLIYYSLLLITGLLNFFYLRQGIFHRSMDEPMLLMKRLMALATIPAFYFLYKAYSWGEVEGAFTKGLLSIGSAWLCWAVAVVISFFILRLRG